MEIILTEKDLHNAVKLYLAHSGVTRHVLAIDVARKLKGPDAGLTVSLELAEHDLTEEELEKLRMEAKKVRELDSMPLVPAADTTNQVDPVLGTTGDTTAQSGSEALPEGFVKTDDAALVADDAISIDTEATTTPDAIQAPTNTPATETEPAPVATPEELGASTEAEEMPENSPFHEAGESVSYDPGNPFDEPVSPFSDEQAEAAAQSVIDGEPEAETESAPEEQAPAPAALFG